MADEKRQKKALSTQDAKKEFLCENLSFAGKEAYKRLRTNLQFSFTDNDGCNVIGVTSSHPTEGKSLTAINLAYSMAQLDKKVLLIDADMRRSSVDKKLDFELSPGLSNLLTDVNSSGGTFRNYEPEGDSIGFTVITAGDTPPNPSELLNSERMNRLLAKLRTMFDFIVIDLPPVGAVVDAQTVSQRVDGMIIVVRENNTTTAMLNECVSQLHLSNAHILGFVLNGAAEGSSKSYGKYGKYGKYGYSNYNSYYK